ncbi:hypothetical protein [Streptomyces gilvosporeus]|uniref:Uncharacterized protein n=1 Tax=Streptomyces gilvosporeus TaxID=553510 RepID=A0A1V0TYM1_9ACTN|nr:hypothetical protein [Streptomyces gilvosporeus]ARF58044.1 hypothetical protein B1H19_31125 [Streptomyces gilvosporeus]
MATRRNQTATIILAKGGTVRDITIGDCLELREIEAEAGMRGGGRSLFYLWLKELDFFRPTRQQPCETSGDGRARSASRGWWTATSCSVDRSAI